MKLTRCITFGVALLLAACGAVTPAVVAPARAQHVACLPTAEADAQLRAQYGAAPAGYGLSGGRLTVLYPARDGSTWTVLVTAPGSGISCMVAAGEHWEAIEPPPEGDPS
ncbi:MAG: hypothetical protein RIB84_22485 [Sneathiellaceae bacterium]